MPSIFLGLLAGFLGSVVMAVLMMAMAKGQPGVNTLLVARVLGKSPADPAAKMGGIVAHFAYGSAMGAVFVLGSSAILIADSWWLNGLLFGVVLFLVAAMAIMPAAGLSREKMKEMPKGRIVGFLVFHLIYGAVLAGVIVYAAGLAL